ERCGLTGFGIEREELETHEVGMLAGEHVMAARARATRKSIRNGRFAQQRLREMQRERVLADAARTMQQQRVRQIAARGSKLRERALLPWRQDRPRQRWRATFL